MALREPGAGELERRITLRLRADQPAPDLGLSSIFTDEKKRWAKIEPVGAAFGASVVVDFPVLLPLGLGFAAGAMLFVVSHEIIPESHRQGHENFATGGLMVGFVMMMMLDTAFS